MFFLVRECYGVDRVLIIVGANYARVFVFAPSTAADGGFCFIGEVGRSAFGEGERGRDILRTTRWHPAGRRGPVYTSCRTEE
jgi:hypothetical protein